ncbi:hypothetical protein, partial [Novosphingobium sp. FSW06-99]|uniref:hypothetical protein n=1 Tax=Novosphingobium sp. FSW06-99 TaxID=1739113 RepID=UPI0018D2594B
FEVIDCAEFDALAASIAEMLVLITVIFGLQDRFFYQIDVHPGSKQGGCHTIKRQIIAAFKRWSGKILPDRSN